MTKEQEVEALAAGIKIGCSYVLNHGQAMATANYLVGVLGYTRHGGLTPLEVNAVTDVVWKEYKKVAGCPAAQTVAEAIVAKFGTPTDHTNFNCTCCGGIKTADVQEDAVRKLMTDWLSFSEDVMPNDAAGHDWLEGLKSRTKAIVAKMREGK